MRRKRFLIVALVLALLPAQPIYADTITVDTTSDVLDAAGSCGTVTVASLPGADGDISLREAICAANNNTGADTINFNIPGGGVQTIQPSVALPFLTDDDTTINGYSQPGTSPASTGSPATLLIEIDGTNVTSNSGLNITSANNVVQGLVINRFSWHGVVIGGSAATGNIVSGNYIGTDASGTGDLGNAYSGVYIRNGAQNNIVGGDTTGARNVISDNGQHGVLISGSDTMSNTVSGNYIGTDASGTDDRGNTWSGVYIDSGAQNNTVGGDTAGERNVISGNDGNGVYIYGSSAMSNTVSGNYIGTDASGTAVLGNTWYGVRIRGGAQNNTVGPGNVIAYHTRDGVEVNGSSTSGNTITQNSIFSNTMGIDLAGGANGDIAAPLIMTTTVGSINIVGEGACPNCAVEVFENSDADGEGETYVGDTIADASGAFTVTVSYLTKPYLTATATDETDGTSEFSDVFEATVELAPPTGPIYLPIITKNH